MFQRYDIRPLAGLILADQRLRHIEPRDDLDSDQASVDPQLVQQRAQPLVLRGRD